MTSLLERTISIIAPHSCIFCSKENNIVCNACQLDVFDELYEACYLCNSPTLDSRVCSACAPRTAITHVWMAGTYAGARRVLVRAYKFERKRAAYKPIADAMAANLPYIEAVVVVPIPTASVRVRVRGYDQSKLLAQAIAKQRGWRFSPALRRLRNDRQVGSSRTRRFAQAQKAFELINPKAVQGQHILLVDDVTTSGATLQAAGALLGEAGAARVDAVVAAKHILTSV